MADAQSSQAERIERLKALLTGRSASSRTVAALASGGVGNLLFGVALHGAGAQGSRALTGLEQVLVDVLATVVEGQELEEWGAAYRQTVQGAAPGTLTVPAVIAERPLSSGFAFADLEKVLPQLAQEALEAPNVSLLSVEDIAAGRIEEDAAFVAAMGERGFAVTGVARYPDAGSGARAAAADAGPAAESWRVRMQMESFYVARAVGDQGGGRDEIYFTSAASVGGDNGGQTFVSEEFGAVKQGQTHTFSASKKVFLDKQSSGDFMVASLQVWEADQSNSKWYDNLQMALNTAVGTIDSSLNNPVAVITDPIPAPVAIAFEIAKIFISLMDALRNNDDLSCSRTFVLTRDDMAVLHHQPELEWNFNGDGHHKLRVSYTGERPVYPTGSITVISRPQGPDPSDAGPWSAPVPLGWKTKATPALASFRGELYTVFSRASDNRMMWSRYDGTAWSRPALIAAAASDQPSALAVHNDRLHWMYTGGDRRLYHAWFNGQAWSTIQQVPVWETSLGPSLAEVDGVLWSAHTGGNSFYVATYRGSWSATERFAALFAPHSAPALTSRAGAVTIDYRLESGQIMSCVRRNPAGSGWAGGFVPEEIRTNHAPTVHSAGGYAWMVHRGTDRRPYLVWRADNGTASYTLPAQPITHGSWTCTALAAPSLTTHDGRMYAIYHA
ncbi:hypothetical protein OEIGOIKO_03379 [Streptomyces chrestomyceticus JCM 4735]|uniref:Uncharacterized protein n=1 Tax=Streptomyces chrestomyceticus JCM 4735 TaxID=1306181 RepID=A0A7U9PXT6_9ACTN|nr:hypothetical protein [Streptomyces chrestomyceticus]GCD35633.1 hypothetical protein OEIGOIKO_03379 [Streptomyces chrestomyceticus JCM 4735]